MPTPPDDRDREYLRLTVDLAREAVDAGDEPFGSLLVAADGSVLARERNHAVSDNETRHPEFDLARFAGEHLTAQQRATATVYTSGEHCPMCSAAHAWVGLGPIVYASSGEQTAAWAQQAGAGASPVTALTINDVAPGIEVRGPEPSLADELRELHLRFRSGRS